MALVRSARLVAIAHTEASVQKLVDECTRPAKRKCREAPVVASGPGTPSAILYGLATGQSQTDVLRLVCPTLRVSLRDILEGGGKCLLCLEPCDAAEMAVFTGHAACCRKTMHSTQCPMTQPGSLCFSCAASTIGGGWNSWQDAGGPRGQPKCPYCNVSLCENDVVRVIKY